MNAERLIFALWMTALNRVEAFTVHLQPKDQMRHVEDSLELTCTAFDCPRAVHFAWRTVMDHTTGGKVQSNHTVSRMVFKRLSVEDEKVIICSGNCGTSAQDKTRIRVYSFPSDPVISSLDVARLKCEVHDVYPAHSFQINWFRENTLLHQGKPDHRVGLQDIYSTYTPTKEDLGKNITCRVSLSLSGVPEKRKVRAVSAQYGPTFMTISNNTTVKIGERLELRCDADGNPEITWKKLGKREAISKNNLLVVERATWSHAGEYECEAKTALGSRRSKVNVSVRGPPKVPKIRLSQATDLKEGDNVTIFCDSDSVPPAFLAIYGTTLNQDEKQSGMATVSINIRSIQLKDSGLYHCEAQNELGSERSSMNITVRGPPRNSTVMVYPSAKVMEAQNITIHCSTTSFPRASIFLRKESDGSESVSTNGFFHLFNLRSEDRGTYTVNFTNELGYEIQSIELIVKERYNITPDLPKIVAPAVSSVSLLTAAAVLLRHLRRRMRILHDIDMGGALDI